MGFILPHRNHMVPYIGGDFLVERMMSLLLAEDVATASLF
jgi:hypothetical protein